MSTSTEAVLPDKDTCLALYRQMLVIRRCEEQLARSKDLPGPTKPA